MIFHHTGSMDTYITNKIINNESRAEGANVGYASTIDLFKLYGETTLKGVAGTCTLDDGTVRTDLSEVECNAIVGATFNANLVELSRGLIHFDLDQLKSEIEAQVDVINESSLTIKLVLSDVQGTQVAPSAFALELCPLNVAFEEGLGDNVVTFGDSYSANWLSPSAGNTWSTSGGADDIGSAIATQVFTSGLEDLEMDITAWVKAYWDPTDATVTTNNGWMLKFIDEDETDVKSYFVKRFSSRHTRNPMLRPKVVASWESYHEDDHLNFVEGSERKLSIRNFVNGVPTDPPGRVHPHGIRCRLSWPDLDTGTWVRFLREDLGTVAKVSIASKEQDGMFEATLTPDILSVADAALADALVASGSLLIQERWDYIDDNASSVKLLYSGSLTLQQSGASTSAAPTDYRFSLLDVKSIYLSSDKPTVRLFVRDRNLANEPVRIPIQLPSKVISKAYYQVKDTNNQNILIPFSDQLDTPNESTRISRDSEGMYFSFPVSVLPRGRTYTIDIGYYDRGIRRTWESNLAFKVK